MTTNIRNLKVHLALKDYEFMEFEVLGVETLEQAQELAKTLKNAAMGQEMVLKPIHYTNCDHPFQAYKEMSGVTAKGHWTGIKCQKCGSVKFNGGEWKPPRSEELQIGGEK